MIRLSTVVSSYRRGGLREILRLAYMRTRHLTPAIGDIRYNGLVTGEKTRLLDVVGTATWGPAYHSQPLYESALVAGLRRHVGPGERVVVVGGGHGVTAAVAALAAGPRGHVDVYEAGDGMLDRIHRTLALNGVEAPTAVHHAIVGAAHEVYGDTTAAVVPPETLPACDVLMLDCEGAEREILAGLTVRPRVILVETHGLFGAPTADVRALVEALGYHVRRDEIAEAGMVEMCLTSDVRVLTAFRDGAPSDGAPGPAAPAQP